MAAIPRRALSACRTCRCRHTEPIFVVVAVPASARFAFTAALEFCAIVPKSALCASRIQRADSVSSNVGLRTISESK